MKYTAFILAVLVLAGSARAEDAQPVDQQIAELRQQVEALRREVAELKKMLAAQPASKPVAKAPAVDPAIAAGLRARKLIVGMTKEQVEKVTGGGVGGHGEFKRQSAEGELVYAWQISNSLNVVDNAKGEEFGSYMLLCTFQDGKLVEFKKSDLHDRVQR